MKNQKASGGFIAFSAIGAVAAGVGAFLTGIWPLWIVCAGLGLSTVLNVANYAKNKKANNAKNVEVGQFVAEPTPEKQPVNTVEKVNTTKKETTYDQGPEL